MTTVGIRELRNRLGRYLALVRRGEIIEVTDRGTTVARIVPAGVDERLDRLLGQRKVTWSGRPFTPPTGLVRQHAGAPSMSDAIAEDRR